MTTSPMRRLLLLFIMQQLARGTSEPMKSIKIPGDIMIGGLFPMHEEGTGGRRCGQLNADKGDPVPLR